MKNTKITLIFSIVLPMVFAGCQTPLPHIAPPADVPGNQKSLSVEEERVKAHQTEVERLLKLQDKLNSIVVTKDINKCGEITDDVYFKSCNVHILANQAVEEKKLEICDKGTTDEIKQTCRAYYSQEQQPKTALPEKKAEEVVLPVGN
jgi:hypothetical protein